LGETNAIGWRALASLCSPDRPQGTKVKTEASLKLASFELTLGDLADIEVEKLHALSLSVGWPHRPQDWQMLREAGQGIVALDGIGRVLGSAMWFFFGDEFASIGMVITSPRLQAHGTGRWLMNHVLTQTGSRSLGLSATRAARRLYRSLNFAAEKTVYQCQGEALPSPTPPLPVGTTLRELRSSDLAMLSTLDHRAYGADRSALLGQLLDVSKGVVLLRNDRIEAFSLCRRFGRGSVVGPVVALTDLDAIAVTHPHVQEHAGRFLRLDTRQKAGAFPEFLTGSGLPVYDTVTTMSLGRRWPPTESTGEQDFTTYALVSQALG